MLFGTSDHGALLRLAGQKRKAIQYVVGNPVFALQMTQHDIRASLYAPLRVLIYENCQQHFQNGPLLRCSPAQRIARLQTFFRHKFPQLQAKGICGEKMLWRWWPVCERQSGSILERG
jgi:Domain of unknown function DUF302